MSYADYVEDRSARKYAPELLGEYIASLTEGDAKALAWLLRNVSGREALEQLNKHGFKCSRETIKAWAEANPNVV
jgi:hypothetical protein